MCRRVGHVKDLLVELNGLFLRFPKLTDVSVGAAGELQLKFLDMGLEVLFSVTLRLGALHIMQLHMRTMAPHDVATITPQWLPMAETMPFGVHPCFGFHRFWARIKCWLIGAQVGKWLKLAIGLMQVQSSGRVPFPASRKCSWRGPPASPLRLSALQWLQCRPATGASARSVMRSVCWPQTLAHLSLSTPVIPLQRCAIKSR